MKKKIALVFSLIFVLLVSGCAGKGTNGVSGDGDGTGASGALENADGDAASGTAASEIGVEIDTTEMFTDRDFEVGYDESESALIQMNGDSAACSSDAVHISGSTVTITDEGTYILTGTLNDGRIIVNAGDTDKPHLVLKGVSVHSETSAPLYILEADKVFVTLAADTSNILSNGGTFTAVDENNIDGAVFSKQDLTFNGSGSLTVTSPAGHGIVCKDDLVFTSGTYTIDSASHGLDANDSVRVANAALTINSGKDGIHAENSDDTSLGFVYIASGTFQISAEGDGISAGAWLQTEDGEFDIISGGGSVNAEQKTSESWGNFKGGGGKFQGGGRPQASAPQDGELMSVAFAGDSSLSGALSADSGEDSTSIKGLKAAGKLIIHNGTFTIDAADDAVHSNASIAINGGAFEIASGDDAFHADETMAVAGGTINITESYEGIEGLHVEISGGDITLTASDDGLNAAGGTDQSGFGGFRGNEKFGGGMSPGGAASPDGGISPDGSSSTGAGIIISGGSLYIKASGDGIDANGTLTISGGYTTVCGPAQGDTATLDYDSGAVITGGTFIGTGSSGMAQTFSDSGQGVIAINAGNQSAGAEITLTDSSGKDIITYAPELAYSVVIISSPDIVKGETYKITVGSSSGEFTAS